LNRIVKVIRDYPWRDVWALFRKHRIPSAAITAVYVLSLMGYIANADGPLHTAWIIVVGVVLFAFVAWGFAESEKQLDERIRRSKLDNDEDQDDQHSR